MMRAVLAALAGAVLTGGAMIGAGSAVAAPTPPVPTADQLTAQLKRVLSTDAADSERAAALQGGQAAVPTANNIAAQMSRYDSMVSWHVENPALNGNQLDAQLSVSIPLFGAKTHQLFWVPSDGAWKLSNASACVIATQVAGTDCTV
jgi:hypothetical protein